MGVKVKFLALVADIVGVDEDFVEVSSPIKLNDFKEIVYSKYPKLRDLEKRFPIVVLINGVKAEPGQIINDGDEVAFMPPASGG
ncbi:MoaD/ThiS family protein [Desulfurococcaceae archaeon MEX13E-LK6-19]|nr:MoaD/ThiS family protein [Desulfurococcaceae archaeon MEX13E-LK6-19]